MSEWISVDDKLPEINEIVLVCDIFNVFVSLGRIISVNDDREKEEFVMINIDNVEMDSEITHWMPLPKSPIGENSMNKDPQFAFEKTVGIIESAYSNPGVLLDAIGRLFVCMKETNKIHGMDCKFFRLDFRQPYLDERFLFPNGYMILHMKWGSKKELEKNKEGYENK